MAEAAQTMAVPVDSVDAGGRVHTFARPDGERRAAGPLAETLAERLAGSAQAVDARASSVGQRSDGLVSERTGS